MYFIKKTKQMTLNFWKTPIYNYNCNLTFLVKSI